ncbi:MAG: DNA polymerase III subunit gamma/tau [Myxococcaceae bacterium]
MKLVNRVLPPAPAPTSAPIAESKPPPDVKLFAPEGSAEGCASGDCLPGETKPALVESKPPTPPPDLAPADEEELEAPRAPAPTKGPVGDDDKWRRAVEALREASPRHGKSLSYARFLGFTPEGVRLAFPQDAAFHRSQVIGMSRALVESELAKSLGRPVKLLEETNAAALENAPKSIAEVEASDRSSREKGIEERVRAHPALRNVIRHLGGALEHIAYLEPVSKPRVAGPVEESSDATSPND